MLHVSCHKAPKTFMDLIKLSYVLKIDRCLVLKNID